MRVILGVDGDRERNERIVLLYEGDRQARGFAKENAEGDTAACTRRGISYKLGETLPSFKLFTLPRDCIYPARFVRNLITTPRAFSYYYSTKFRVIPFWL